MSDQVGTKRDVREGYVVDHDCLQQHPQHQLRRPPRGREMRAAPVEEV